MFSKNSKSFFFCAVILSAIYLPVYGVNTDEILQIKIHLILDARIFASPWKPMIQDWIRFSSAELIKAASIQLSTAGMQTMEVTEKEMLNYKPKDLITWLNKKITPLNIEKESIKLVYLVASWEVGYTLYDSPIIYFLMHGENQAIYPYLLLHEFAHLFGAVDVDLPDTIMNEDSLRKTTGNSFDEHNLAIMNSVRRDMQKNQKNRFLLSESSPEIFREILPHIQALMPNIRDSDSVHYHLGCYYQKNHQHEDAVKEFQQAIQDRIKIYKSHNANSQSQSELSKEEVDRLEIGSIQEKIQESLMQIQKSANVQGGNS